MENTKISIVVPIYNAEKYIDRCVSSILAQSYRNLEVLLMDDGSTDGTPAILDDFAKKDDRVRVIHKENTGHANSRNCGLLEATGEFITFMDCDDYMHPDFIEKMYGAICEDGSDMACCSFRYVDEEGKELDWTTPVLDRKAVSSADAQRDFLLTHNIEGFSWNKLVRRSIMMEQGLRYAGDQKAFVDMLLWYRFISFSGRVSYVADKLYDYYQMPGSVVHSIGDEKMGNFVTTTTNIRQQATENGLGREGEYYQTSRMLSQVYDQIRIDVKSGLKSGFLRKYGWEQLFGAPGKEVRKRIRSFSKEWEIMGGIKLLLIGLYLKK